MIVATHKSQTRAARPARKRKLPAARVGKLLALLDRTWPAARSELEFKNPFELLVATILSAQSTDRTINAVTPALFKRWPDAAALAAAAPAELERMIYSTGFFRAKARSLLGMAGKLTSDFRGKVPRTMEAMLELPGVARKTANVVLGSAYGIAEGVVVDTHVMRLSHRLGLSGETDPVKIERDLMAIVPRERWILFGHQLILHGRRVCHARAPDCEHCPLAPVCPSAFKP
jgi:endonuclease-3